jgi:membrane associated rhomboid family serine protease
MKPGSLTCARCGALNARSASNCYRCGARLGAASSWLRQQVSGRWLVTRALVVFCLCVFALGMALDHRLPVAPETGWGAPFRASTLLRLGLLIPALVPEEPWRVLSAVFLHFSALHLLMNLWGLFALGRILEDRFGAARSLLVFGIAGIGGFVVSDFWYGLTSGIPTAGASGGIFGQLGALIGVELASRRPGWKDMLWQNVAYALVLGLVFRVNTAAHLGGFGLGFGLGYVFEKERVRTWTTRILSVLAVLFALASVASIVLCFRSPIANAIREREIIEDAG